jgi:hypothetical protein
MRFAIYYFAGLILGLSIGIAAFTYGTARSTLDLAPQPLPHEAQ